MGENQNIRISVRNLVEFILRSGDIDNRRSGPMDKDAMQEGSRIHRKIQGRMGMNYRAEVPLSIDIQGKDYVLTIEGRADGVFREESDDRANMAGVIWMNPIDPWLPEDSRQVQELQLTLEMGEEIYDDADRKEEKAVQIEEEVSENRIYIDEIKGIYRDVASLDAPFQVHLAQAKCYAYIYGSQNSLSAIGVQMTYCNIESEEIRRFRQGYRMAELEAWFGDLVKQYQKWAEYQNEWRKTRQSSIGTLTFPFAWRTGQKKVAGDVYRTMLRRKKLFIQAPTGTGKTISTIFPAVKAVGEGLADRIFYATAKTITRTVAEETYALLRTRGLRMKTVTLTAKEKICFLDETECNPDACPYAKGHFDRVNDAVFDLITSTEVFDRKTIEEYAEKWQVCPFEFGLDVSLWSDGVICDYNYIFDPRAKLKRFFGEGVKGDYLFLIDEAHNLVERGREMFSAALYKEDFLALKKEVRPYSQKMARALNRCNSWMLERKRECERIKIWDSIGIFPVYLMNLCGIMETFLEESHNGEINEKVLELYFQVRRFLDTCDRLDDNYLIYSELCEDGRFLIRLFCVDISTNLQECLAKGKSTVFFSATFLPIQYYKSLLSTCGAEDYAIYAQSVFEPEKRLVLIGTDTSSRYTNRNEQEYRKMAAYVLRMIQAKRGNYMVFFPSYRMMEEVAVQFQNLCSDAGDSIELLCQSSGMTEQQREAFLGNFEEAHDRGLAGFCVMGGIFGEGIDLKHDRLIGAVIVGTGIPQVCNERELLKYFYDRRGQDGFFYAYLCPGMNKVLQSAGRVIRTEEDRGIILLLDERFASHRYSQMFPEEWKQIEYCTLGSVQSKAGRFWDSV